MSLPTQTYYAEGKSFFAKNTQDPVFSTLTVSQGFAIDGQQGQTWDCLASLSSINTLATVQYPNTIQTDWQSFSTSNAVQQYTIAMNGTNNTVTHAYSYDGALAGALQFTSSLTGGGPGIQMTVASGNTIQLREENTSFVMPQESVINIYELNSSNTYLQYYASNSPPGVPSGQIHFNEATSSISLVNSFGQSIAVGNFGVGINPGTSNDATLVSGRLNISNLPIVNVSSINGAQMPGPVTQWINPVSGPFPTATTPGNTGVVTPIAYFSTVTGNVTRVSMNYQSDNVSGGNPTDQTQVALVAYNSDPPFGPIGVFKYLDTYPAVQTDDPNGPYQVALSCDFQSQDAQAGVVMINLTANGNIQTGTLFTLTTQDMGSPNVNY
jgi:hypothetical protein